MPLGRGTVQTQRFVDIAVYGLGGFAIRDDGRIFQFGNDSTRLWHSSQHPYFTYCRPSMIPADKFYVGFGSGPAAYGPMAFDSEGGLTTWGLGVDGYTPGSGEVDAAGNAVQYLDAGAAGTGADQPVNRFQVGMTGMAIREDGTLFWWGQPEGFPGASDANGPLGPWYGLANGGTSNKQYSFITNNGTHAGPGLAIQKGTGELEMCGSNSFGIAGRNLAIQDEKPQTGGWVFGATCHAQGAVALHENGQLHAWGDIGQDFADDPAATELWKAVNKDPEALDSKFVDVAAAWNVGAAIKSTGEIYCWSGFATDAFHTYYGHQDSWFFRPGGPGDPTYGWGPRPWNQGQGGGGRYGGNYRTNNANFVKVVGGVGLSLAFDGTFYGLREDGSLYGWGANLWGQLDGLWDLIYSPAANSFDPDTGEETPYSPGGHRPHLHHHSVGDPPHGPWPREGDLKGRHSHSANHDGDHKTLPHHHWNLRPPY